MNATNSSNDVESNIPSTGDASAPRFGPSSVTLALPISLGPDEVFDLYWAECKKQEQRAQIMASLEAAMLTVFNGMGVIELPVTGLLFALASQLPDATQEMIRTCCVTSPGLFEFRTPKGIGNAPTVRRVVDRQVSRGSTAAGTAENLEGLVNAITAEPHKGASYYKPKLGLSKGEWQAAIELALESGAIDKRGERSNTVYFPKVVQPTDLEGASRDNDTAAE